MKKFLLIVVIIGAYFMRHQFYEDIDKACSNKEKKSCAWSITMLSNVTNSLVLLIPFIFSSSCSEMVLTIGLALFLTTQMAYLEMVYL